jgi:hypothetical protein
MKRLNLKISVIALAIGMFAVSCSGGGSKQQSGSATPETQTETAGSGSLEKAAADLFPGSGLTGFVPTFAAEVKPSKDNNSASFLIKPSGEQYNDSDLTNEQYNEWVQSLYNKAKALSEDGKVYKYNQTNNVIENEITAVTQQDKNLTYPDVFAYKYNGKWWQLSFGYFMSYSKTEKKPGVRLFVKSFENDK